MTPKKNDDQDGDDTLGVLDDSASLDDAAIGFLGATAQVSVAMPTGGDEEDLEDDDDVLGDEIAVEPVASDLVIDRSGVADEETVERLQRDTTEIIIELPAEAEPPVVADLVDSDADEAPALVADEPDVVTAEVVLDDVIVEDDLQGVGEDGESADDKEPVDEEPVDEESVDEESVDEESVAEESVDERSDAEESVDEPSDAEEIDVAVETGEDPSAADEERDDAPVEDPDDEPDAREDAPRDEAADVDAGDTESAEEPAAGAEEVLGEDHADDLDADDAVLGTTAVDADAAEDDSDVEDSAEPVPADEDASDDGETTETAQSTEAAPAAAAESGSVDLDAGAAGGQDREDETTTEAPALAAGPLTAPEEETTVDTDDQRDLAPRPAAAAPRTRAEAHRTAEIALASKRLGDASRESSRESADLLTAERLLDPSRMVKPEPEGTWSHLVYTISGRRINLGDGKKARARKELTARISGHLQGNARFVPVLSRKGGVGKTTVTALLGMALADARDDRVIAVDANPDRGTLADRVVGESTRSVRDLVRAKDDVQGFHDVSALVARDSTRLDVLASDSDPRVAEAFGDSDYRDVASVAAHYYSLVLTDTGTGIVHDVMGATLDLADQIVIVSGLSVDEARLASETLTWLESNGYADKAREAIVVLNQSTSGTPLVRLNELQAHFSTRVGHVVRIPYDSQIAGGGAIVWTSLAPETRLAARELAAQLVEGLRAGAAVR